MPAVISADDVAIFLDVDGTLLGFKSRPGDVMADANLLDLLRDLRDAVGGALALVSGRMIADLDRIVAPLVFPAAGTHGAEIRFADGQRLVVSAVGLGALREPLGAFVAARPGLMLEDKGATIAIHYRAAPERRDELRQFLSELCTDGDIVVQDGKLVAELKLPGCNKGQAIATMIETAPFAGRRALFIGDDLTDEHGFHQVNAIGGLSVKVGPPDTVTAAHARLDDPEAVRAYLRLLCPKDGHDQG